MRQAAIVGADDPIPVLDLKFQATELIVPITRWGRIARTSEMTGTYYHYTDDYRFKAIWSHPDQLPDSGCRVAVEPNYSTWPAMDPARLREGKILLGRNSGLKLTNISRSGGITYYDVTVVK